MTGVDGLFFSLCRPLKPAGRAGMIGAAFMKLSRRGNNLRSFNKTINRTILLLGTALLLQACSTTADHVAVTNNATHAGAPQDFSHTAAALSNAQVKVFGFDDPAPASPFTDAGPGYAPPSTVIAGSDPNVTVFALDGGGQSAYAYDGGVPPLMPPTEGAPYRSPFPGSHAPVNTPVPYDSSVVLLPLDDNYHGGYESGATITAPAYRAVHHGAGAPVIYFAHGSARIGQEGRQTIRAVAQQQLRLNPAALIEVEGHASTRAEARDPVERRILNLKMSMDRAFSVSSDLIRNGIPASAIKVTAYGDTRPAAPAAGKDGEAASRRVVILTAP